MILPFESKLSHQYYPRNRFTETPLYKPGAGTNLEACIFSMPNKDIGTQLTYVTIRGFRGSAPSDKCICPDKCDACKDNARKRICTSKFSACKDTPITAIPNTYALLYLPEARILIFKTLVFFFQKLIIHELGLASISCGRLFYACMTDGAVSASTEM